MRDDRNRATIALQLCDGKTDALDRNRALEDCVFFDLRWDLNMQPPIFGIGDAFEFDEPSDAVHMSLNDVPAEAAVGLHRQLQVNQRTFTNAGERSSFPRLRRQISGERLRL